MKKFYSVLLLFSLFLTGCNGATDSYSKKKECGSFQEDIESDIEQKYGDNDNQLEQIFYSPSLDSCLYAFYSSTDFKEDVWRWYFVFDFFTKEMVYTSEIIRINKDGLAYLDLKEQEFNDKIMELKK